MILLKDVMDTNGIYMDKYEDIIIIKNKKALWLLKRDKYVINDYYWRITKSDYNIQLKYKLSPLFKLLYNIMLDL